VRLYSQSVCGQAVARIASAVAANPNCDVYAFLETFCTSDTCSNLNIPGYTAHHCVRPHEHSGRGRPSGGITVFLRQSSPVFGSTGVSVKTDASAGIVWVEVPAFRLSVACVYFSPANSRQYRAGALHHDPVGVLTEGLAHANSRGYRHVVLVILTYASGACEMTSQMRAQCATPLVCQSLPLR
jgi:hypothetical protein